MDKNPAMKQELSYWYQSLIGMLMWVLEIVRVDIIIGVSMMESQMVIPRGVNLAAVLRVLAFFCKKYYSRMAFDPTYPAINMSEFKECKWKDLYG